MSDIVNKCKSLNYVVIECAGPSAIGHRSIKNLQQEVSQLLEAGWKLHGKLEYYDVYNGRYVQALTK